MQTGPADARAEHELKILLAAQGLLESEKWRGRCWSNTDACSLLPHPRRIVPKPELLRRGGINLNAIADPFEETKE
jgi:hypothetical protein